MRLRTPCCRKSDPATRSRAAALVAVLAVDHHGAGRLRVAGGLSGAHGRRCVGAAAAGAGCWACRRRGWWPRSFLILGVARRLARGHRDMEAAARRVELEFPDLGSDLINVVQLSEDRQNASRAFCQAAVDQAAARLAGVAFERAAAKQSRWRRLASCMQTPRDLAESLLVLALLIAAGDGLQSMDAQLAVGRFPAVFALGVRPLGRLGRDHARHAGQRRGARRRKRRDRRRGPQPEPNALRRRPGASGRRRPTSPR